LRKYICVHGHFYQPPREDPWTGEVALEPTAQPFHDWNERLTSECYAPNAASPILDEQTRFKELFNNYSSMSFNFGPTLLNWLELHAAQTYEALLQADRLSMENFEGHGSAISQVYNHMIMPLANARDKRTQIEWGRDDFKKRFGRNPEGMWLPETAADLDTLEALAEAGIKYSILAPHQASSVRKLGKDSWSDVSGGRIDTKKAYLFNLPSGKKLSLFFYDASISRDIAFGPLLESGEEFAKRFIGAFGPTNEPQLVNVATDGETYGHHHRHGEMALANALARIRRTKDVRLANYGLFLSLFNPAYEVRIIEQTSWSCPHGVERWRSNCGCGSEIRSGWNQEWRTPLRGAMSWLRDRLDEVYQREGSKVFKDPWRTRDQSITAVSRGSKVDSRRFVSERSRKRHSTKQIDDGFKLLEMERCSMLMFASCAWYWEDISRIETIQVMKYAAKAIEISKEQTQQDLRSEFERQLEKALSNDKTFVNGRKVFELATSSTAR
jgi:alpha-amylase/alpha-mannosidase (GH57 family)